jgi:hypothetical protein
VSAAGNHRRPSSFPSFSYSQAMNQIENLKKEKRKKKKRSFKRCNE